MLAGVLQAAGYGLWIGLPGFAGFVLWGVGGSFASGTFQALVYDGLRAEGAEGRFATVIGRCEAASLAVQAPVAGAASALFKVGGYALAGWVSVCTCLAATALAAFLPDERPQPPVDPEAGPPRCMTTLRAGLRELAGAPALRGAVLLMVGLYGSEALEEYFGLLASSWGIETSVVPLALLAIPLAGAAGALLGGRAARLEPRGLTVLLAAAAALAAADIVARPLGLVGVAAFYGLWRVGLVVAEDRLQAAIAGPSRATITSVAGLGAELAGLAMFAAWAAGGLTVAVALVFAAALLLPRRLGSRRGDRAPVRQRD